jgi:hypothetical protein
MRLPKIWKHRGFGRKRIGVMDFAGLALDASEVIAERTRRAMTGKLTAAETSRMVAEKPVAGAKATFAFATTLLAGDPKGAPAASFKVFRKAVSGNRRRLKRR